MSKCSYENWSLVDVAEALRDKHSGNRIIKVPQFQRSIVWKPEQKKKFIDSLKEGFPIGTLLFAKTIKGNQEIYELIDGLQRSSTIKNYIESPTEFFDYTDVSEELLNKINEIIAPGNNQQEIKLKIRSCLIDFIKNSDEDIKSLQYFDFVKSLSKILPSIAIDIEKQQNIIEAIRPFIKDYQKTYSQICDTRIPIIVYSGEEQHLPEIFARINNQGTVLNQYQIYAALWSGESNILHISNKEIVAAILNKYDTMVEKGFSLYDYDREELETTCNFNIYEYVFGFSKFICNKFPNFFIGTKDQNEVDSIGFELMNACLGRKKEEIKTLHDEIKKLKTKDITIEKFENCILEVIDDVNKILSPYINFKGNIRSKSENNFKIFHTKNQIISIIASTFRAKYDIENELNLKKGWKNTKKELTRKLPQHYVYDVLAKNWNEGGIGKAYSIIINNKYLQAIPKDSWESMLGDWFQTQLNRKEAKSVANAKESDYLFLNCIYNEIFTFKEHEGEVYDVDHIVSKNYMKLAIKCNQLEGLPISCIANLCYIPESLNRSKKDKPLYKDKEFWKGKDDVLPELEKKYYFTTFEDLSWMPVDPTQLTDIDFSDNYIKFLKERFNIQKEKFYASMKII